MRQTVDFDRSKQISGTRGGKAAAHQGRPKHESQYR